jgi:hypothetical protein
LGTGNFGDTVARNDAADLALFQRGGSAMRDDENHFALMLGHAVLTVWGDVPRDIQEALFETAVKDRPGDRDALAKLLHERHPRTMHAG